MFGQLEVLKAAQAMARHSADRQFHVARNIAHADTPGYRATDLRPFEDVYDSGKALRITRSGHLDTSAAARTVERPGEESPNGNTVSVEIEMVAAADVKSAHDRAVTIYGTSMDILRASLGRIR